MKFPREEIKTARKALGLTQAEAAALTHDPEVSLRRWSCYENGHRIPRWDRGMSMSRAVGIEVCRVTRAAPACTCHGGPLVCSYCDGEGEE